VCDSIRQLHAGGDLTDLVLAPIGFLSDHMEVAYDLDTEAAALCRELGVNLSRAATVGVHPAFVSMIRELILERTEGRERRSLGTAGSRCDTYGPDCCPPPKRAPVKSSEAR
ncbi:MAG: ferrochelatase, partial [Acidobacteria bacterium]|nr:ferrochelatase [Acidobacteriota bacterium]